MANFRYRPKDNRTPVNHPVLGHLEWDTVVESDASPGPDFEPDSAPKKKSAKPAAPKSTATDVKPAAAQQGAGKTGGK